MAIMASKGADEDEEEGAEVEVDKGLLLRERDVRSVVDEPRRSPAPSEEAVVDWIWEAE